MMPAISDKYLYCSYFGAACYWACHTSITKKKLSEEVTPFTSRHGATYVKNSFTGRKKSKTWFWVKCVLSRHIPFTYFADSFKNELGTLRSNKSILLLVRKMVHMAKMDAHEFLNHSMFWVETDTQGQKVQLFKWMACTGTKPTTFVLLAPCLMHWANLFN